MKQLYLDGKLFSGTEKEFLVIKEFEWKAWYQNGKRHREDGPAEIWSGGTEMWYQNGLRHRTDGPADIWPDGDGYWWINNIDLTWINDWIPLIYWICGD